MVSFGEKVKIKKAGNLNQGRSYVFTTVHNGMKIFLREYSYFKIDLLCE
jgi:hypothetical protein